MSDSLTLILSEMNDAGIASKKAGAKDDGLAAVRRVAENYGYDYEDLDDTFAYYRKYGTAPTQDVGGFARELAGGALFEFSDEIGLAQDQFLQTKLMTKFLKEFRDRRAYFDRNPVTAISANVMGGLAMPAGS